jgi:hypothetical protein
MASGHEYRANRPNTWLLRPLLQSEDSSCQPGAVHTWPISDSLRGAGIRPKMGLDRTGSRRLRPRPALLSLNGDRAIILAPPAIPTCDRWLRSSSPLPPVVGAPTPTTVET